MSLPNSPLLSAAPQRDNVRRHAATIPHADLAPRLPRGRGDGLQVGRRERCGPLQRPAAPGGPEGRRAARSDLQGGCLCAGDADHGNERAARLKRARERLPGLRDLGAGEGSDLHERRRALGHGAHRPRPAARYGRRMAPEGIAPSALAHFDPADLLDALTTGIVMLDAQLCPMYANVAAQDLLAFSLKKARGRPFAYFLHAANGLARILKRALEPGAGIADRELAVRPVGAPRELRTLDVTITPLTGLTGT